MKLVLEDGTELQGQSFGYTCAVAGEVVFNTGMTGYVETLTDASYKGQILVTTFPLLGNYGVPPSRCANSLGGPFESAAIQIQGLVVQNYIDDFSHHSASRSLANWLVEHQVPAVCGIDTRTLTRKLREFGTMRGWLFPASVALDKAKSIADEIDMAAEVFETVVNPEPILYKGGDKTILLIDIGAKDNIVRSLLERGVSVVKASWKMDLMNMVESVDGILIGNGPGDPKNLTSFIDQLKVLLDTYKKPIFGICLGHQLMCLAAGGETFKLPYGHRSVNQPVQDLLSRRCYITSQNHGYAVKDNSLPAGWEPWFVNINDGTNEGFRALNKPFFSVQFHPEAHPGPTDTGFLFDQFLSLVHAMSRG